MDDMLLDAFTQVLRDIAGPPAARIHEKAGDAGAAYAALAASGFLDALVPEAKGGAGLTPADIAPLALACGEHLLVAPFLDTCVARALLAAAGEAAPDRPILLWPATPDGRLRSTVAPLGVKGALALVQRGDMLSLVETGCDVAGQGYGLPAATIDPAATPLLTVGGPGVDLMTWAAAIKAANIAGALTRLLRLCCDHANERKQFGKPIGKFQAIQQQLSVLAERTVSAQLAARLGLSAAAIDLPPLHVATACSLVGAAAAEAVAIAHAVHGAIGISEEYDLQLYTRRIAHWQLAFGSQTHWSRSLGQARLAATAGGSVDFVRGLFTEPALA